MDNDTLSKFGTSFQIKVLTSLVSDEKFLEQTHELITDKYFESESNKWIVGEILDYFLDYKTFPSMDVFKVQLNKLEDDSFKTKIVDDLRSVYKLIGNNDLKYVKDEFTAFCKNQNLKNVIIESVDLLKLGNYDRIKQLVDDAMKAGTDSDIGHDYVNDFIERTEKIKRDTVGTKWEVINELMDGGLGPGELGVVVAPSGVGKSWVLCSIAAGAVKAGKTVLHYTYELSEYYVGKRYDTIFSGIPSTLLDDKKDEVEGVINDLTGKLLVKYYPPNGVSAAHLQTHIDKCIANGYKPDLIIIDYADLMLSKNKRSDSVYAEQGSVYIDLRGLSGEYGIPMWTASQANRNSISSDVIQADKIADSYAKVMNADFIMSLSRLDTDKLNDSARIHIMKNRFGPDGMTFNCTMNPTIGKLEVYENTLSDDDITAQNTAAQKTKLHQKYMDTFG